MNQKTDRMSANREIVTGAFAAWMAGTQYVSSIFADEMTWEITGRSAVSRKYVSAADFVENELQPFGARFGTQDPFRPVNIRAIYEDEDAATIIVLWDGRGTTIAGTIYANTYAWAMTLGDGKVVAGTAFFDSIALDELWEIEPVTADAGPVA